MRAFEFMRYGDAFVVWKRSWWRRPECFRVACWHEESTCPYQDLDLLRGGERMPWVHPVTERVLVGAAQDFLEVRGSPAARPSPLVDLFDQEAR